MCILQRFYDAIMACEKRKRIKLEKLLREAMPFYDSNYAGGWYMEVLIEKILVITDEVDGKFDGEL